MKPLAGSDAPFSQTASSPSAVPTDRHGDSAAALARRSAALRFSAAGPTTGHATRSTFVATAAMETMSRRGVNATSVREVVRHTGTPRGSISPPFSKGQATTYRKRHCLCGSPGQRSPAASDQRTWCYRRLARLHRTLAENSGADKLPGRLLQEADSYSHSRDCL